MDAHTGHQRIMKADNSAVARLGLIILIGHKYLVNLRQIGDLRLVYVVKYPARLDKKLCSSSLYIRGWHLQACDDERITTEHLAVTGGVILEIWKVTAERAVLITLKFQRPAATFEFRHLL